jgi:hypothetical protein
MIFIAPGLATAGFEIGWQLSARQVAVAHQEFVHGLRDLPALAPRGRQPARSSSRPSGDLRGPVLFQRGKSL